MWRSLLEASGEAHELYMNVGTATEAGNVPIQKNRPHLLHEVDSHRGMYMVTLSADRSIHQLRLQATCKALGEIYEQVGFDMLDRIPVCLSSAS
jgi:hypothetical protein